MSLCLTREELRTLSGYKQRSKILAWLRQNGFRPRVGGDGWPRVDRTVYERVMSGSAQRAPHEPDFGAIK